MASGITRVDSSSTTTSTLRNMRAVELSSVSMAMHETFLSSTLAPANRAMLVSTGPMNMVSTSSPATEVNWTVSTEDRRDASA
ncbi:MAG: hypothetical protein GWO44_07525 [Thermoplasmata archaeon]|nr:hypothetical protein [Thermoplasmata archaeon]NIY03126.1 hypothetical protein [Thermoplasmata archaeon]